MRRAYLILAALILAGCANIQIPPSPQEIADKKMDPVPGKAVVYIVQDHYKIYNAGLTFDDGTQIRTWPGTFYRWVTTPGRHTIQSSEGNLNAKITLNVEAGQVYFVQHKVNGIRGSTTDAWLASINDRVGHELMASARLCCATR